MQFLTLPCTADKDDQKIRALCKQPAWQPHEATWLGAYAAYRAAGSDPWQVGPATFNPDVADAQRDLYEKRKRLGPIKRIRYRQGLLSCPMCGSGSKGDVDHLLPRRPFAEFSIMRANLVPACGHCNSASKGNKHRGDAHPERFIHPYFDQWAAAPIWQVTLLGPNFDALTFEATPLPTLLEPQLSIVRYHLKHVLGEEFKGSIRNLWSTYPGSIKVAAAGSAITVASTNVQIDMDLARRAIVCGVNAWEVAFLRGLRSNPAAISHVAQAAAAYPI